MLDRQEVADNVGQCADSGRAAQLHTERRGTVTWYRLAEKLPHRAACTDCRT